MKKLLLISSSLLLLTACGLLTGDDSRKEFDPSHDIHVITRENGAGTRASFVEIVDIKDEQGEDAITQTATVQNGTSVVMQGVAGDQHAIGYISLGSLNDSIKGIEIDGAPPTTEAIAAGDYTVTRNFNVVYGSQLSPVAQDFYDFFFSAQAQEIAGDMGYVGVNAAAERYEAQDLVGDVSVVGSTSVEPLMTALSEAYREINPQVTIDITAPGSGAGIQAAIEDSADIGMSSRELSADETAAVEGVDAIAVDGIAIILNQKNPVSGLSLDQLRGIYEGKITNWSELVE